MSLWPAPSTSRWKHRMKNKTNQTFQLMTYNEVSKFSPELMSKYINSMVYSLKRNLKIKDNEEDMELIVL